MRRIISAFLTMVLSIGILCSFASCAGKQTEDTVIVGDYLSLLCKSFGMETYNSEVPYASSVDKSNEYFDAVQVAFEWNVVSDENLNVEDNVTKAFLSETLVNCVGIEDVTDMTEKDIHKLAADNGYLSFSYDGEYSFSKAASKTEITDSINKSMDVWTNRDFESVENVSLSDNVVDAAAAGATESDIIYDDANDTIAIPEQYVSGLEEGDVFAVPTSDSNLIGSVINSSDDNSSSDSSNGSSTDKSSTSSSDSQSGSTKTYTDEDGNSISTSAGAVYKAEKVQYSDGYAIITKSDDVDGEDVIEELEYSKSVTPDLASLPFYGPSDELLYEGNSAMNVNSTGTPVVGYIGNADGTNVITNTATTTIPITVKTSDSEITGSIKIGSDNSYEISLSAKLKKDRASLTVTKSYKISDISLDTNISIKSALSKQCYVLLNYSLTDSTGIEVGLKEDEFEKKVTIGKVPLVSAGLADISLVFKVILTVSGEIKVEVTTDYSQGIEIKGKNFRAINEKQTSQELIFKAKAEIGLEIGIGIFVLKNKEIIGLGVTGGVGIEAKLTCHIADKDNVLITEYTSSSPGNLEENAHEKFEAQITTDESEKLLTCIDATVYWFVKIGLDSDCTFAGFFQSLPETKLGGSKDGVIYTIHIEDGTEVDECTRKFSSKESTSASADVSDVTTTVRENALVNGSLDIDVYSLALTVGTKSAISITAVPSDNAKDNIKFSSSDTSVATVDSYGNVTAVAPGRATITASTSDKNGNYEIKCSVFVTNTNTKTVAGSNGNGGGGSR